MLSLFAPHHDFLFSPSVLPSVVTPMMRPSIEIWSPVPLSRSCRSTSRVPGKRESLSAPVAQWQEKDDGMELTISMPSYLKKDHLKLDITDNVLTLKGEHRVFTDNRKVWRQFTRSFTAPAGTDLSRISAEFQDQNHSLRIVFPKTSSSSSSSTTNSNTESTPSYNDNDNTTTTPQLESSPMILLEEKRQEETRPVPAKDDDMPATAMEMSPTSTTDQPPAPAQEEDREPEEGVLSLFEEPPASISSVAPATALPAMKEAEAQGELIKCRVVVRPQLKVHDAPKEDKLTLTLELPAPGNGQPWTKDDISLAVEGGKLVFAGHKETDFSVQEFTKSHHLPSGVNLHGGISAAFHPDQARLVVTINKFPLQHRISID